VVTSVIVLSDKSSGSSLLQRLLAGSPGAHLLRHTPHHENESLYWVKAAAALGLPQPTMMDSRVVPMSMNEGRAGVRDLLDRNAPGHPEGPVDENWVMTGWDRLAAAHGPTFVEKSPHHLHSTSAIELIERCAMRPGVDLRVVGLVRHPVDTLYSMWCRWSTPPQDRQHEWVRAYRNLLALKNRWGGRLCLVRYEDLISDREELSRVTTFCGLTPAPLSESLRADSVGAAGRDLRFAFNPGPALCEVAAELGYGDVARSRAVPLAWPAWRAERAARRVLRGRRVAALPGWLPSRPPYVDDAAGGRP
jgi:hypothetical protein